MAKKVNAKTAIKKLLDKTEVDEKQYHCSPENIILDEFQSRKF